MKAVLAAALLIGVTAPATDPPRGAFERTVAVAQPGRVVVTLDRDVYERARRDLGDLRVFDDGQRQVPYLIEAAREAGEAEPRRAHVLNRSFVRGNSSSLTLDFGAPVLKSELALSLSGDNFRRRVAVEGRNKHEAAWETLTDGAYVFAVPPPWTARYETVPLPENNFQFLRVTVFDGPDDREPVDIREAWARPQERRRPREQEAVLPLRAAQDERAHETVLMLDLGARHQPFRGVALDVADPSFFRGVVVEAQGEALSPREEPYWHPLAEGTLYRYDEDGHHHEQLRIDVCGRERMLRLRIRNRDDRPLQIRSVAVLKPIERLVFTAEAGRAYRLTYGSDALDAPVYDVARTVGDPVIWIAQATEGQLGPPARAPQVARLPPWTERHPALVWSALGVLVVLLGAITWRALLAADRATPAADAPASGAAPEP
jgi:hypothetical protein